MPTTIRMPLRELNEETIKALQEKYPDAEIRVDVHRDPQHSPLSEARFWEVIAMLDWDKEGNDEAVIEPAVAHLAAGPVRHIFEFADILSEKLYLLDGSTYAKHIGEGAWSPEQYFSVDNFLYARACVIANGREAYEKVLKDPELMPKDITFEALLYMPSQAYERKTGKKWDYTPAYPIETYSNKEGWKK